MKKFMKPVTLLPILIGIAVGALLFLLGDAADAPGLSLIGLASAFLLMMWGVYTQQTSKTEFLKHPHTYGCSCWKQLLFECIVNARAFSAPAGSACCFKTRYGFEVN